jgi:hypothetical protein
MKEFTVHDVFKTARFTDTPRKGQSRYMKISEHPDYRSQTFKLALFHPVVFVF